jgi:glycerophosphoryl diester phosphodiesterase
LIAGSCKTDTQQRKTNILNIAHRGARSLAPENTLAAAQAALDVGADMWELDVGVTADGELILIHDDSLARTTNVQARFSDRSPWHFFTFSLAEIKSLDAGSFFLETDPFGQIAAGAVSPAARAAIRGQAIPTLHEALLFTRDHNWRVNVEIKALPPAQASFPVVEKVLDLVNRLDMLDSVLLSSFYHPYLRQAKKRHPALATAALLSTPYPDPLKLLAELECSAYHPYNKIITPEQITRLRQAGFEVNVWTVNDEAEMQALIQAGVTGLITDFPQLLKTLLS